MAKKVLVVLSGDYPLITGRSTADSYTTGKNLIEVPAHGLQRYGW